VFVKFKNHWAKKTSAAGTFGFVFLPQMYFGTLCVSGGVIVTGLKDLWNALSIC